MSIEIEAVQELVGRQLGKRGVGADDHLQSDLGVESLDVLSIVVALEDKYRISLEDDEIETVETVRDLHALLLSKAS